MRITYSDDVDAAYVELTADDEPRKVQFSYACDPVEVGGQINLDFDATGRLIGIEILTARAFLTAGTLAEAGRP